MVSEGNLAPAMTPERSRLPELLPAARTPLEVLCALADVGVDYGLDLWAMAIMRGHVPTVYLCTAAPLPPAVAATNLAHFIASADAMECEGDLLMPDWSQAAQQVVCLQPYAPVMAKGLAEYRDTHVCTGQRTGAIIRAATLSSSASEVVAPAWEFLPALVQYVTPHLRATDLTNADTARGMIDADSGMYSWPYFVDVAERECDRARRYDMELSVGVVELRPARMLREIPAELHRRVGEHLLACVRSSDLVGRIGHHSYAVFFHNTGPRPALIAAGRIADALNGDPVVEEVVSFSIGVSGWEKGEPAEISSLLAQAGEAAGEAARVAPGCAFVYI